MEARSQTEGLKRSTPLVGVFFAGVDSERSEEFGGSVVDVCLGDMAEVGPSGKIGVVTSGIPDSNSHISVWKRRRGSEDVLTVLVHWQSALVQPYPLLHA